MLREGRTSQPGQQELPPIPVDASVVHPAFRGDALTTRRFLIMACTETVLTTGRDGFSRTARETISSPPPGDGGGWFGERGGVLFGGGGGC
jgi:hypothetical protein